MTEKKVFQGPESIKRSMRIGQIIEEVMNWPEEDLIFLINDLTECLEK
jgi:hypothetical protein